MSEQVAVIFRIKRASAGQYKWDPGKQAMAYVKQYEIEPMMELPAEPEPEKRPIPTTKRSLL